MLSNSLLLGEIRSLPPAARQFFWIVVAIGTVGLLAVARFVPSITSQPVLILGVLVIQHAVRVMLIQNSFVIAMNGERIVLYSSDLVDVISVALIGPWSILGVLKLDPFFERPGRASPMRWLFSSNADVIQICMFVLIWRELSAIVGVNAFSQSGALPVIGTAFVLAGIVTEHLIMAMIALATGQSPPPRSIVGIVALFRHIRLPSSTLFHSFTMPLALATAWSILNSQWMLVGVLAIAAAASQWLLRYFSIAAQAEADKVAAQEREQAVLREMNTELEQRVDARTAELASVNGQLHAANKARIESIMKIAHDGNNRVQAQMSIAYETLFSLDEGNIQIARTNANGLIKAMMNQAGLFTAMQRIAQAETGSLPLEIVPVDIYDLMHEIMADYRIHAQKKNIALGINTAGAQPIWVVADRDVLRRVLDNLISNAIRYTEGVGTRVSLAAQMDGTTHTAVWTCSDDGIGLSEDALTRIGTQFARFGGSQSPGGTGLGVWGAVQFVRAMHGDIAYQSAGLNLGTTVAIRLPLYEDESSQKVAA